MPDGVVTRVQLPMTGCGVPAGAAASNRVIISGAATLIAWFTRKCKGLDTLHSECRGTVKHFSMFALLDAMYVERIPGSLCKVEPS